MIKGNILDFYHMELRDLLTGFIDCVSKGSGCRATISDVKFDPKIAGGAAGIMACR